MRHRDGLVTGDDGNDCPACEPDWHRTPNGNRFRRTNERTPSKVFEEYECSTTADRAQGRRAWKCVLCGGYGLGVPGWIAGAYRLGKLAAVSSLPDLPAALRYRIRKYADDCRRKASKALVKGLAAPEEKP